MQRKLLTFVLHIKKTITQIVCSRLAQQNFSFLGRHDAFENKDQILFPTLISSYFRHHAFPYPQLPPLELLCCLPLSVCHLHHTPFTTFCTPTVTTT